MQSNPPPPVLGSATSNHFTFLYFVLLKISFVFNVAGGGGGADGTGMLGVAITFIILCIALTVSAH
jgi:hypothetical protein